MDPEVYYCQYGPDPMKRQLSATEKGLRWVAVGCWRLFIYSPLLITGYYITLQYLGRNVSALWWIACVATCALLLYQVLFLLKGILIGLKQKGNLLWLILIVLCVSFTTLLPAYLALEPAAHLASKINSDPAIGRILVLLLSIYIYTRYNFHKDSVPPIAAAAYRIGYRIIS